MLCETGLNSGSISTRKPAFVTCSLSRIPVSVHFLVLITQWQIVSKIMWLPTPIYERIPQFWFLLGLLFFATGLYLGFEYFQSFYYLGVGVLCCTYGVSIFLIRLYHRSAKRTAEQAPVSTEQQPVSEEQAQ